MKLDLFMPLVARKSTQYGMLPHGGPWLHHKVIDKREHVEEAHTVQENTEARVRSGISLAFLKQLALTVTRPVLLKHFISLSLEVIHRYCLTMNLSVIYFHH